MERKWTPMELIGDLYCENMRVLTDHRLLSLWMLRLCQIIGMTPVGKPIIEDYPWPGGTEGAPSVCLFLQESSITVHVYPEFDYLFLNVFSCKAFDPTKAKDFIKRSLKVRNATYHVLQRGLDLETRQPLRLKFLEVT